jgi:TetR/AcrR family transcriptional repressor of mexJK operon
MTNELSTSEQPDVASSDPSLLSRSEQKRKQILDAGRELFMSQGFEATSMDQVTAKSGVSKATVYNHFPSKEKLFEETIRTRSAEVFAALPELDAKHANPEQMLTEYFYALLQILLSEDGACMCLLLMSEGRRFPENARLIYESGFGRGMREMALYLKQLHEEKKARIPEPDWAATKLLGLMMPPLPLMCAAIAPLTIPSKGEVNRTVRLFLKGLDAA